MERIHAAIQKAKARHLADAGHLAVGAGGAAVSPWTRLAGFEPDREELERNRVVTFGSENPARGAFDAMGGRLLLQMRRSGWVSLGVTSPTAGCGKTTVALNLAFSLARRPGLRTLLVDLDFHRPTVAARLGLAPAGSMADAIRGERSMEESVVRVGEGLAIGANAAPDRGASGLLLGRRAADWVKDLKRRFRPDLILYDLPPVLVDDGVVAFSPHLDAVLITAAAEESRCDEVGHCEAELSGHCQVLGVVLNKCRYL
jgi:protein-tyrosine kinase